MKKKGWNFTGQNEELRVITINVSITVLGFINKLIDMGIYTSRSECIRSILGEILPKRLDEFRIITAINKTLETGGDIVEIDGKSFKVVREA